MFLCIFPAKEQHKLPFVILSQQQINANACFLTRTTEQWKWKFSIDDDIGAELTCSCC
jgi:hypothetical protein